MISADPQILFAAVAEDLVVLDRRRDAYLLLPDALTPPVRDAAAGAGRTLTTSAADTLVASGFLSAVPGDGFAVIGAQPHRRPVHALMPDFDPRRTGCGHARRTAFALALGEAWLRLATRRYGRARLATARSTEAILEDCAWFRRMLAYVPGVRRCLPRALILRGFLRRRGTPSTLVFGVRTHPFLAHCWLEAGDAVLDADLAETIGYEPILAL